MSAFDAFKFARTYEVVRVGFKTYHYDVFDDVGDIILNIYHQETLPMTSVLTFKDTLENRKSIKDCYNRYLKSERYKSKQKPGYVKTSASDAFKFARTYQVVEVGFTTYDYDVFDNVGDIILNIYHQETSPMTTVITFKDTSDNRKRVQDSYNKYVRSERYKTASK